MTAFVFKLNLKHCLAILTLINLSPDAFLPPTIKSIDAEFTPPFPQLTNYDKKRFHIIGESVDEQAGIETFEEYHDIERAKSTHYLVKGNNNEQQTGVAAYQVKYFDWIQGLCYNYQPYSCIVTKTSDLADKSQDSNTPGIQYDGKYRAMGIYGLWLYANINERTYSKAQIIYSASKEVFRQSLLWTVRDEANKLDIKLFFIADNPSDPDAPEEEMTVDSMVEPSLEMIQIETDDPASSSKKRLIRTINILSIDYDLSEQELDAHFDPPVGFGCFTELVNNPDYDKALEDRRKLVKLWTDWTKYDTHTELEVTATKYGANGGASSKEERVSETYNVDVALSRVRGQADPDFIELVRFRNTDVDDKIVVNHLLNVVYTIDMRQGTCKIYHVPDTTESDESSGAGGKKTEVKRSDELYDKVLLRFKRIGLELDVSSKLFKVTEDVHFVKKTLATDTQPEMYYFEGGAPSDVLKKLTEPKVSDGGQIRKARMIWTYELGVTSLELKSITIWVLNELENRLLESYQVNLISGRKIKAGWPDQARLFDVSEECYLENELMKQNRDYAWIQFTYPASSRALAVLARNEIALKTQFYSNVIDDFTRAPRLELMFEDDSFVIRMLLLDLPATELIYDKTAGQSLVPVGELGDLNYMAPSEHHCGHMCRINYCTVMTYCQQTHACLLSSRSLAADAFGAGARTSIGPHLNEFALEFKLNTACVTYKMPVKIERNNLLKRDRLHNVIAHYQHQNYDATTLPKQPDEILLPLSETGLTATQYLAAFFDYKTKLNKHMSDDGRSFELVLASSIEGHFFFFIPNRFELENDPLHDLNIYDDFQDNDDGEDNNDGDNSDNDQRVPRFHTGLAMSRYNVAGRQATGEQGHKVELRVYTGLSYDQCALACTDSKCGSFSYCNNNAHECVLSSVTSVGQAQTLGLVEQDVDCYISQRDFLANFVKFDNIYRPQVYTSTADAADPSDCALACVSETKFKCLSFEFCSTKVAPPSPQVKSADAGSTAITAATAAAGPSIGQCYYQIERHMPGISQQVATNDDVSKQASPVKPSGGTCDHYSRSYLADFIRIESRRVVDRVINKLKTSTFEGLSVFSCAERCTNELLDCTAFQFCHTVGSLISREVRQCTTIESKVTPQVLREAYQDNIYSEDNGQTPKTDPDEDETIVDEQDDGHLLHAGGKYLQSDANCQLFTMRRDSSEAHLRDLAFRGLVKTAREKAAEIQRAKAAGSGGGLSFFGGLFLYIAVALVSAAIGCGAIILKDNSAYVRQKYDRVRILLGV